MKRPWQLWVRVEAYRIGQWKPWRFQGTYSTPEKALSAALRFKKEQQDCGYLCDTEVIRSGPLPQWRQAEIMRSFKPPEAA